MSSPILSIIVPVYKSEKYLDNCIRSIIVQNFKDWELILVDDGSPDNRPQICNYYSRLDDRIKVLHIKNGGQSRARNVGIDESKGEYITFVDSDDDIEPNTYEENISLLIKDPEIDFIQFPQNRINWGNSFKKNTGIYYIGKKELFFNNYQDLQIDNAVWNKIYRKESIGSTRFREGHVHEDKLFILELIKKITVVYISNKGGYNYYKREGSTLNTYNFSKLEDWIYTELVTLDYMYEFHELKEEWLGRWMYNVRFLMNQQKTHSEWNIKSLLYQLEKHKPHFFFVKGTFKDIISYLYIKIFGIQSYYNKYMLLLDKRKKS